MQAFCPPFIGGWLDEEDTTAASKDRLEKAFSPGADGWATDVSKPYPYLVQLLSSFGVPLSAPDESLAMYNLDTGRRLATFPGSTWGQFSPDGQMLAVAANRDSELHIYDLPLPSPIPKIALSALLAMAGVYGLGTAAVVALSRKRLRH